MNSDLKKLGSPKAFQTSVCCGGDRMFWCWLTLLDTHDGVMFLVLVSGRFTIGLPLQATSTDGHTLCWLWGDDIEKLTHWSVCSALAASMARYTVSWKFIAVSQVHLSVCYSRVTLRVSFRMLWCVDWEVMSCTALLKLLYSILEAFF